MLTLRCFSFCLRSIEFQQRQMTARMTSAFSSASCGLECSLINPMLITDEILRLGICGKLITSESFQVLANLPFHKRGRIYEAPFAHLLKDWALHHARLVLFAKDFLSSFIWQSSNQIPSSEVEKLTVFLIHPHASSWKHS